MVRRTQSPEETDLATAIDITPAGAWGSPAPPRAGAGVAVVMPARDEAPTVASVVGDVQRVLPAARVFVVDDASCDSTAAEAASAGAWVLRLPDHAGYAGALLAGYRLALARGAERIVQVDADGQHDPADLEALLAASEVYDLVVGSRFLGVPGYRVPAGRRAAIAACRWMAARVGGLQLTDPTSGYRVLRRPVAERIAAQGFPRGLTESSLLIDLHRRGWRIGEVPVSMRAPSGRSMHRGLAGGRQLARISWAVLAQAREGRPRSADRHLAR